MTPDEKAVPLDIDEMERKHSRPDLPSGWPLRDIDLLIAEVRRLREVVAEKDDEVLGLRSTSLEMYHLLTEKDRQLEAWRKAMMGTLSDLQSEIATVSGGTKDE